jgi:hypothetical protein
MPNVVKVIKERTSELAAMDKVVYYFSPKVSLIFGQKNEVIWKILHFILCYLVNELFSSLHQLAI